MNRATLNTRHAAAVTRYGRALVDNDGQPPAGLLAELAAIADEHARDQQPQAPAEPGRQPSAAAGRGRRARQPDGDPA